MKKKTVLIRFLSLCLVFTMLAPLCVSAAVEEPAIPYASSYLDSYNAYVYPAGSGKVAVYISVVGDDYMDEIGALTVILQESTDNSNWTRVKTFTNGTNPELLGYNKIKHNADVSYQGVAGRYYRAYVTIWAGKDGDGDSRYMWTSAKKAT